MIEMMRQWLISVTCAALIAALAESLMPKGGVGQIGKLVCAMVLVCAMLRPVLAVEVPNPNETLDAIYERIRAEQTVLQGRSEAMMKTLIERDSGAYIVDKAAGLGVVCQAQVECVRAEGGTWLPYSAYITGQMEDGQRKELTAAIQNELGILPEHQVYAGGE